MNVFLAVDGDVEVDFGVDNFEDFGNERVDLLLGFGEHFHYGQNVEQICQYYMAYFLNLQRLLRSHDDVLNRTEHAQENIAVVPLEQHTLTLLLRLAQIPHNHEQTQQFLFRVEPLHQLYNQLRVSALQLPFVCQRELSLLPKRKHYLFESQNENRRQSIQNFFWQLRTNLTNYYRRCPCKVNR